METGTRVYEGIDIKVIIPESSEEQAKSSFTDFLEKRTVDGKSYLLAKVIADTHPSD